MDFLFKCPEGTDAVVVDHQQFDADEDGLFLAPVRYRQRLEHLGFECLGEPPVPAAPPSTEGTGEEGEAGEGETEQGEAEEGETEQQTGESDETVTEQATEEQSSGKGRRKRG